MSKNIFTYNNFDEIITAEKVDNEARQRFTRKWLRDEYGIEQYDKDWLNQLSDVHNHDDLPKHFGQVRIGSSFSALTTALIRLPEGWHLAISKSDGESITPIHPKHESSYTNTENQKHRLHIIKVLKTGKIIQTSNVSQYPIVDTDSFFEKKDKQNASTDSTSLPIEAVTPVSQVKTTSVNIDLSSYGL
jgi:hypothetical protein